MTIHAQAQRLRRLKIDGPFWRENVMGNLSDATRYREANLRVDIVIIAWQHVQGGIGRKAKTERLGVVSIGAIGRESVRARRGGLDARDPLHQDGYLERILAQCRIPFSKNNPRLMSPILSIPTSVPFSTTGIRRKFLRPMYEAASRMGM